MLQTEKQIEIVSIDLINLSLWKKKNDSDHIHNSSLRDQVKYDLMENYEKYEQQQWYEVRN